MKTKATQSVLLGVLLSMSAQAELQTFFGENVSQYPNGPNTVPRPTDLADTLRARNEFLSHLKGTGTETFEGFAAYSSPTTMQFGTNTATLSGNRQIIEFPDPTWTIQGGFPLSGTKALDLGGSPGTFFTVTFNVPHSAFGFFVSDVEEHELVLTLVSPNGERRDVPVPVTRPQGSGGAFYFAMIDRESPFIAVEFHNVGSTGDGFDFDDMTVGTPEEVIPAAHLSIRVSQVELCWLTASNAWYQLQYRSSLTTNQWVAFSTNWLRGDGTFFCTNDAVPIGQPQRFYQVVVTNSEPHF